jgi:hypothetical protein
VRSRTELAHASPQGLDAHGIRREDWLGTAPLGGRSISRAPLRTGRGKYGCSCCSPRSGPG